MISGGLAALGGVGLSMMAGSIWAPAVPALANAAVGFTSGYIGQFVADTIAPPGHFLSGQKMARRAESNAIGGFFSGAIATKIPSGRFYNPNSFWGPFARQCKLSSGIAAGSNILPTGEDCACK